jgi:hypothetical protein
MEVTDSGFSHKLEPHNRLLMYGFIIDSFLFFYCLILFIAASLKCSFSLLMMVLLERRVICSIVSNMNEIK